MYEAVSPKEAQALGKSKLPCGEILNARYQEVPAEYGISLRNIKASNILFTVDSEGKPQFTFTNTDSIRRAFFICELADLIMMFHYNIHDLMKAYASKDNMARAQEASHTAFLNIMKGYGESSYQVDLEVLRALCQSRVECDKVMIERLHMKPGVPAKPEHSAFVDRVSKGLMQTHTTLGLDKKD